MKLLNISFIIFIIILLILYINYPNRYKDFMINENNLEKMSNKIYYIKKEYDYKRKILKLHRKLLQIDDLTYYKYVNSLNDTYNRILRIINTEIDKIKNLNKIYQNKIKNLNKINNLCIIKKEYGKELYKIQDLGYIVILNLEKENSKLLNNLYNFNKLELKNKNNEFHEIQQNYLLDMKNINKDYYDKIDILTNKLKSNLKNKNKKKYKCNLHISWNDTDTHLIKCCRFKPILKSKRKK